MSAPLEEMNHITQSSTHFDFAVEAGKVKEFAAATLSGNFAGWGPSATGSDDDHAVAVPPTFFMAVLAATPPADSALDTLPGGVRSLYGEQQFDFVEPVVVGDRLTVRPGGVTSSQGKGRRGGMMTFVVTETIFEKEGRTAVIARGNRIITSVDVSAMPRADDAGKAAASLGTTIPLGRVRQITEAPIRTLDEVKLFDRVEKEVVITRAHIARYARASGDFAPIHLDDEFARGYGNPSVFAHGMLSGGITATLIADWVGALALRRLRMRFTSRVFPGDVITYAAAIRNIERKPSSGVLTCDLTASNQHLEQVLVGTATAELPTLPH